MRGTDSFSVAVYSDIHIGCRHTPPEEIVDALIHDMKRDLVESPNLSLIIIAGDLWDRQLTLSQNGAIHGIRLLTFLDSIAVAHSLYVYVLAGTPRHDREQSRLLHGIYGGSGRVFYVPTLSLKNVPILGRSYSFLFVPDEHKTISKETERDIRELLTETRNDRVDFVVMHGYFIGSLPESGVDAHDPEFFNGITKYAVYCGHVHKHFMIGKIVSPNSHNRVAHGENDDKGHVRSLITGDAIRHEFVKNELAWDYITIKWHSGGFDEFVDRYKEELKKYRNDSNMRVIVTDKNSPQFTVRALQTVWPNLNWTIDKPSVKRERKVTIAKRKELIPITRSTMKKLVIDEAIRRGYSDEDQLLIGSALDTYVGDGNDNEP